MEALCAAIVRDGDEVLVAVPENRTVDFYKYLQSFVYRQKLRLVFGGCRHFHFLEVNVGGAAAVTLGGLAASAFDEDAPHRLGGGREKVSAPVPFLILVTGQSKPGFMDQRSGL